MMKRILFLIFVLFLVTGCQQSDTKTVKIFGDAFHKTPLTHSSAPAVRKTKEEREAEKQKAVALAQVKSEENQKIAQIEAAGKERVKRIEVEATKLKVLSEKEVNLESQKMQKDIAMLQEQTRLQTKDKEIYINKMIIAATVAIVILALIIYYIIQHKKRVLQNKLEEDRLRHEEYMQASAQQHEKITRVLGIIADGDTDEYVKKELLSVLKEQPKEQPLITYTTEEVRGDEASDIKSDDSSIDIEASPKEL